MKCIKTSESHRWVVTLSAVPTAIVVTLITTNWQVWDIFVIVVEYIQYNCTPTTYIKSCFCSFSIEWCNSTVVVVVVVLLQILMGRLSDMVISAAKSNLG